MSTLSISAEDLIDRVAAMRKQEESTYSYAKCFPSMGDPDNRLNVAWREKIVHWSYNVVDHFSLCRSMVAISMDLFDRFLATRGNRCTGNMALLTSLTTLHIAIKLHETKKIKISTLANLSRGQFGPPHIEEMELVILNALGWLVHPPTSYSFIEHFLSMLPQDTCPKTRKDLYELSRYLTELTVCDSYFVSQKSSDVAFSAILQVMDELNVSGTTRTAFLANLQQVGMFEDQVIAAARERIAAMMASSSMAFTPPVSESKSSYSSPHSPKGVNEFIVPVSSPTTTTTNNNWGSSFSRSNSFDSFPSHVVSPMTTANRCSMQ